MEFSVTCIGDELLSAVIRQRMPWISAYVGRYPWAKSRRPRTWSVNRIPAQTSAVICGLCWTATSTIAAYLLNVCRRSFIRSIPFDPLPAGCFSSIVVCRSWMFEATVLFTGASPCPGSWEHFLRCPWSRGGSLSFSSFCPAISRDFRQIMHVRVQVLWGGESELGVLSAMLSSRSGGTGGSDMGPEEIETPERGTLTEES